MLHGNLTFVYSNNTYCTSQGWLHYCKGWSFPFDRSGTEEEYGELEQLLHDIYTYREDKKELTETEKDLKKKKEKEEKKKVEEMGEAALAGIRSEHVTA